METMTNGYPRLSEDYKRMERAILYLEENYSRQPSLKEIAASVHLSEFHFQRIFTRWAGVSPKKFMQFLTLDYAKKLLEESRSVLDATYEAGLSSPGRLHDLFVNIEAVTPGEFKQKGAGLTITYGIHPSPFGECLLAVTDRGICGLSFIENGSSKKALQYLRDNWPNAQITENRKATTPFIEKIFGGAKQNGQPLKLFLKGTNFQIKVWEALLKIPAGCVASYEDIAARIGRPTASRAVGTAVANNHIAYLIPCHRVIQKIGAFGNYRWGAPRKKAMLVWESAKRDAVGV
ncbi:MAG: methylated-DNA--[protein]-cysteine S-methyltransferase [candidate division Zixibacteria bacterium]|nr:methylated-DNA--[protein]-cysteine S-methyltransferase [candidate division Zixibacteria bacterium]